MQAIPVTNLPIYLPADKAAIPFGDPLSGGTATVAAPGVFSIPGYDNPVAGDAIAFSFAAGGSLPAPLTVIGSNSPQNNAQTVYYVVNPTIGATSATFNVSATKGGSAITTTTAGSLWTAHLLSGQFYGVTLPFKPSNSVVIENNTSGSLTLQGTNDTNTTSYGNPQGPVSGNWATIAVVPAGGVVVATLNNDWIRVSTSGTLVLQQN